MNILLILMLEIGAGILLYAMLERAHDAKIDELTGTLRYLNRMFGVNKTCLHYGGCKNPGPKNAHLHFSTAQEQEITRKVVEVEGEQAIARAQKNAARRTRKDLTTIAKHAKKSAQSD